MQLFHGENRLVLSVSGKTMEIRAESSYSVKAYSQLEYMSSRLGLDKSIEDEARSICSRAIENHLTKGALPSTIAAASVYIACVERTVRVDVKKLAQIPHPAASPRSIGRYFRLLVRRLNILLPDAGTEAEKYVLKIVQETRKSGEAAHLACKIIELARMSGDGSAGKLPAAVGAAALYLACTGLGQQVTQDELADAASITPASVRHSVKSLRPVLEDAKQGSNR